MHSFSVGLVASLLVIGLQAGGARASEVAAKLTRLETSLNKLAAHQATLRQTSAIVLIGSGAAFGIWGAVDSTVRLPAILMGSLFLVPGIVFLFSPWEGESVYVAFSEMKASSREEQIKKLAFGETSLSEMAAEEKSARHVGAVIGFGAAAGFIGVGMANNLQTYYAMAAVWVVSGITSLLVTGPAESTWQQYQEGDSREKQHSTLAVPKPTVAFGPRGEPVLALLLSF